MRIIHQAILLLLMPAVASPLTVIAETWWGRLDYEMIPADDPAAKMSQHRIISIFSSNRPARKKLAQDNYPILNENLNTTPTEFGIFVRSETEALGTQLEINYLLYDIAKAEGRSYGIYLTKRFR